MSDGFARRPTGGLRSRARIATFIAVVVLLLAALPTHAGTISLAWNPIFASDLAGYRVKYGTDPGALDQVLEVGPAVTAATLQGLADCTDWHAEVYAFDEAGLESRAPARVIRGWTRPTVQSVTPGTISEGDTIEVLISGSSFYTGDPGDASLPVAAVELSGSGLTVLSTTVEDCQTMRVQVRVETGASEGDADLFVYNPDLTHGNPATQPRVFGVAAAGLRVLGLPPSVVATAPAAGAGGADPDVRPSITFSEPIDPTTVSSTTVRLIGESGLAVQQDVGSPQVSGNVVTIFPATPLPEGIFHLEVQGGPNGISDLGGTRLAGSFVQSPGFSVAGNGNGSPPPVVLASSPEAGEIDVPRTSTDVRVTFDRDLTPLFNALPQAQLAERFFVTRGRDILPQASGSPRVENAGRTVVITLAGTLLDGEAYTTNVNLTGDSFVSELAAAGVNTSFAMDQSWSSRPAWRVEGGLELVEWRDVETLATASLDPGAASLDEANTGVPVGAEFLVTFSQPVSSGSVTAANFRLLVQVGRRYEAVKIAEPIAVEETGRTVVLRPVEPLPAGVQALVEVRTGTRGVALDGPQGTYTLGAGTLQTPFATEISGASLNQSIGLGACGDEPCLRSDLR